MGERSSPPRSIDSRNSRTPLPSARASSGRRLGPSTNKATIPRNKRWTELSIPTTLRLALRPSRFVLFVAVEPPPEPRRPYPPPGPAEPLWPARFTELGALVEQIAPPAKPD